MAKVDKLIACQLDRYKNIQKASVNYGKTPKGRLSISYIETRLEGLEKTWSSFIATHDDIVGCLDGLDRDDIPYFKENTYFDCEEVYINYKSDLKSKLSELMVSHPTVQQTQQVPSHNIELKLPSINIPTFSGRYIDWPSFHDIYESLIHKNTRLDDVQKLHYLKTSLSGEAEVLLKNIYITNQNYSQAWETLKKRYNNKRYIANCIFKTLFGIKKISSESDQAIKHLLDTTTECLGSLKNLGLPTESWDAIIAYLTVSKLDNESHRLWEQHIASESSEVATLKDLFTFLENRFRSLEIMDFSNKPNKSKSFHAAIGDSAEQTIKCSYCKADHYIYQCKQFAKKDYKERYSFAQSNNLCFNCLIPKHSAYQCKRKTSCKICHKKHHSLLHPDKGRLQEFIPKLGEEAKQADFVQTVSHFSNNPSQVLLATALVDVTNNCGQTQVYRALIDQGSQSSFVSEDFAQTTGLKRIKNNIEFHLSEGKTIHSKFTIEFEMKSRYNPTFTLWVKAYVISHITTYLPQKYINLSNWPELDTLTLADPSFNKPGKIDMLLGASVTSKIMEHGMSRSPVGTLAQKTQLGWIISGDTNTLIENNRIVSMHSCVCENNMLKQFWELENDFLPERKQSKEEIKCEEIYSKTTIKTETGQYKVKLPFKEGIENPVDKCGETKEIATARFLQLERRFQHNLKLKVEYTRVMQEYLELGHMKLANENNENGIYLPHHAVVRNDKDTSRVRVVYDASCKGTGGSSLNDSLLTGPILQDDLRTLLMKWRKHKIVLTSDIVKMYRQILVADNDTKYQQILWRENSNGPLNTYKLLTVTFGTACAPYLAVRTLLQVAEDEGHKYPLAAKLVNNSFYMDDFMSGCQTIEEALEIHRQMTQLLKCGGFELQKWSSNSNEVLDSIAKNQTQRQGFEIKFDHVFKILGLTWDRQLDQFKFKVNLPETAPIVTKRTILSEVAQLFDPFGWLAPVIIVAKIIIQKLWLSNAGWNDPLPETIVEEWLTYRDKLQHLEHIKIDRWIKTQPSNSHVEIHGFADASTAAYAAVLYVRIVDEEGVKVTLLGSKTKVAPLKQISVPRLELCAAGLVAKLLAEASKVLEVPRTNVYAYTDSMVVLAWIQSQPIRWQTFVANRVAEIQGNLDNDQWSHVKSEANPADLASRGVDPSELRNKLLWWQGPEWLRNRVIERNKPPLPQTELEKRKPRQQQVFCCNMEENILERFSSLNRMIRVLSYCRRFLRLRKGVENNKIQSRHLTTIELRETLNNLIKLEQSKHFGEEFEDLQNNKHVKKRSKLKTLSPYLEEGILRVGGRLQATNLAYDIKHPIILPKDSHLTRLIVMDAHWKLLHGGNLLTINYIRSRYWVIGLKPLVKRIISGCVTCIKHRGSTTQPRMGDLPLDRIQPGRPFQTSGVDYAGPIQIRTSKGRGHKSYKGYICLFVCFSTKAVHLEAVSDLTSQAFIAAFRRFVARRGHCSDLWSDNGTNFVGAAKELEVLFKQCQGSIQSQIADTLANDGTVWHFIPPRAPNFGGLWEAGIKSAKTHLMKVIGNSTLTFEELTTLLTQIEACLNSRPICGLNDNPDDVSALTPAHFLIGEPLVAIPDTPQSNLPLSPLNRWKLVQRMTAHFWNRWSTEYLHTLQQRHKWQTSSHAPEVGEVVLVKEPALPPTKWLMAVVVGTHPGPDGEIRVVSLKTRTGVLKRPVSKLVALLKH